MNRTIFLFFLFIPSLLIAQSSADKYLEEANRMYIKGSYQDAFIYINNYFVVAPEEEINDKALQLGESIFYFYLRSIYAVGSDTEIEEVLKVLKSRPEFMSNRVYGIYAKIIGTGDSKTENGSGKSTTDDDETVSSVKIDSHYSNDELKALLKDSLVKDVETKRQLNTTLILLSVLLIFTIILIVKVLKNSRRKVMIKNREKILTGCRELGLRIDKATGRKNNSINCAELTYKIAKDMGYSNDAADMFYAVTLVYDSGFLDFSSEILHKDILNVDEFNRLKDHVNRGADYIDFIPGNKKELFMDGIRKHHENLDGSGYPMGLSGNEIPYIARVIRVVESYISQVSSREYKDISDKVSAVKRIASSPEIYDKEIVAALDRVV